MTEASETMTQLPLDFSVTMMNIKIKSEMNNNTSMFLSQNNQQSSSAFKVVTPRGKTDGELEIQTWKNFFVLSRKAFLDSCENWID
jgi:hypothetical protein